MQPLRPSALSDGPRHVIHLSQREGERGEDIITQKPFKSSRSVGASGVQTTDAATTRACGGRHGTGTGLASSTDGNSGKVILLPVSATDRRGSRLIERGRERARSTRMGPGARRRGGVHEPRRLGQRARAGNGQWHHKSGRGRGRPTRQRHRAADRCPEMRSRSRSCPRLPDPSRLPKTCRWTGGAACGRARARSGAAILPLRNRSDKIGSPLFHALTDRAVHVHLR